jgi:hypothetical protein
MVCVNVSVGMCARTCVCVCMRVSEWVSMYMYVHECEHV